VPVLAGVPAKPASSWAALLLAAPLAAGMIAGWLLARRRLRGSTVPVGEGVPVRDAAGKRVMARGAGREGVPARDAAGKGATASDTPGVRGPGPVGAGWAPLLGAAVLAGPVAGGALAFAAWASAGPLGGGHLAEVGARAWPLGGVIAGLVAAGAVAGAAVTRTLTRVRRPEPENA
jgi:Family of unknown function (DUF6350)